ncbi:uncharacterized protein FIESC28_03958 [Fusarium coffeatum]|uniref:Uncharacterized protein n=1 Tax=Fusarium coffeatum TaxID=231269 RepID=A0A366S381_9HYPO|nr:uncharacterized protein FIESC28_03958 [Fusarium coffeatum]RBR23216.1 hypothetical protein FIESC28_03958 [Fusarium coffeatum]
MTARQYEDDPTTKELRKKGRKALSAFRVVMSVNASASAAEASDQRRSEHEEQLLSVSSEILATLVDISHSLAVIANSGLARAGTTQMPDDRTWDASDDEDDD